MAFDYKKQSNDFYKRKLDSQVYEICRLHSTERPGSGQYDKFFKEGIYYCAGCGGDYPLFKSDTKFDSGTGWPSFWEPYDENNLSLTPEFSFQVRTEVSCKRCGAHLGHVFEDGPKDKTGQRYCINSLALVFMPGGKKPERTYLVEEE